MNYKIKIFNQKVKIRNIDHKKIKEGQSIWKGLLFDKSGKCLGVAPYLIKRFLKLEWIIFALEDYQSGIKNFGEKMKLIEDEWRKSQPILSDKELMEIFPEAKRIIPEKIKELEEKSQKLTEIIKTKSQILKEKKLDEFPNWFWREWIKINEGERLLDIKNQLLRFKQLLNVSKGRILSKKGVTQEEIQRAERMPIEDVAIRSGIKLKQTGRSLVGLCPFHTEKNPSFHIYPESNSFYCYGCQKGGNVITFVKLLYGYDFPEAVKWLIGER